MGDVLPLPEIVSGEKFEVRRSADANTAYIDLKGRQLVVPFDNDAHAVFVRAHETGHLRWTPLTGKSKVRADVEDRTFQALEDLRINAGLRASGIPTDAPSPIPSGFDTISPGTTEIEVARCLAGLTGRAEAPGYRAAALAAGYDRAVTAADEIVSTFRAIEARGEIAPFSMTLRAAEALTDALTAAPAPTPEPDPGEGEKGEGSPGDSGPGEPTPGEGEAPEGDDEGDEAPEGDDEGDEAPEGDDGQGDDEGDAPGDEGDAPGDEGDDEGEYDGLPGDSPGDDLTEGEGTEGTSTAPGDDGDAPAPPVGDRKIANENLSQAWTPGGTPVPMLPTMTGDEAREILRANFNPATGTADPAPMREILPALTVNIKPPKIASARRTMDTGSIPVAMHRYACDARIFRAARPGRDGVALLIDGSASLDLTEEMISTVLDECPAAVIAVYAGRVPKDPYGGRIRGRKVATADDNFGELIVLANGKRRVPSIAPYHWRARGTGNNVVDRPALEWLAARKERRKLWLCDGLVTGGGNEILSPSHTRAMAQTIFSAKIIRVGSFEDLMSNRAELFNPHRDVKYRADDGRFKYNVGRAGW